jgi:hypothetical protein
MNTMNTINGKSPLQGNSDKSKKIRGNKKSRKKTLDSVQTNPPQICRPTMPLNLSATERAELDMITKEVNAKLNEVIHKEVAERTRKESDITQLKNVIGEFCDTFVTIGYTFEGEPFVIYNAKTAQDHNALAEHLRLAFMNIYKPPLF